MTGLSRDEYPKEEYKGEITIPLVWLSYKKQQLLGKWPEEYDWVNYRRMVAQYLPWGIGWYGQQLPDDEIKRHPHLQGQTEYQDCAALMADQGKWDDMVSYLFAISCDGKKITFKVVQFSSRSSLPAKQVLHGRNLPTR